MPPQAVQPYLGGSSEQRFSTDLVLYVEAEEVVVVAVSMVNVLVLCCVLFCKILRCMGAFVGRRSFYCRLPTGLRVAAEDNELMFMS